MPAYDATQFDPPAPLAKVTLRNPGNDALQSDIPMLLDTSADVTLLPQTTVDLLEAKIAPDRQYELIGFDGNIKPGAGCSVGTLVLWSNVSRTIPVG